MVYVLWFMLVAIYNIFMANGVSPAEMTAWQLEFYHASQIGVFISAVFLIFKAAYDVEKWADSNLTDD